VTDAIKELTSPITPKAVAAAIAAMDRPVVLMGTQDIARLFGVDRETVTQWIKRYADTHPTPVPDFELRIAGDRRVYGWHSLREGEWRAWDEGRPGRGAGGGRPSQDAQGPVGDAQ
jgi:hypothetical protein